MTTVDYCSASLDGCAFGQEMVPRCSLIFFASGHETRRCRLWQCQRRADRRLG